MKRTISALSSVLSLGILFCAASSSGDVEPSPFRCALERRVSVVVVRLERAQQAEDLPRQTAAEIQALAEQLASADVCETQGADRKALRRAVDVIESLSAVLFDPQPEPPREELVQYGVDTMRLISTVALDPTVEPSPLVLKSLAVLSDVSGYMFALQPTAPTDAEVETGLDIMDRVIAVGFDPQPEPPAEKVVAAWSAVSSILFGEPLDRVLASDMVETIDMMASARGLGRP